jgi:hypothetical protein
MVNYKRAAFNASKVEQSFIRDLQEIMRRFCREHRARISRGFQYFAVVASGALAAVP